jgi:hypothetical protein
MASCWPDCIRAAALSAGAGPITSVYRGFDFVVVECACWKRTITQRNKGTEHAQRPARRSAGRPAEQAGQHGPRAARHEPVDRESGSVRVSWLTGRAAASRARRTVKALAHTFRLAGSPVRPPLLRFSCKTWARSRRDSIWRRRRECRAQPCTARARSQLLIYMNINIFRY